MISIMPLKRSLSFISVVMLTCARLAPVNAQFVQQGAKLVGTGAAGHAFQGASVSLSADGNTAIVGGPIDNNEIGAAWVFARAGGAWSQQGNKLVGTGWVNTGNGVSQGQSVSLSADGNTALVGGFIDGSLAGATWVFTRSGGVWSQEGNKLVGTGSAGGAQQGFSVSLSSDGNTAFVGGNYDSNYAGACWVFTRTEGVWSQQGSKLRGTGAVYSQSGQGAAQGASVCLSADGNTAVVGGPYDDYRGAAFWVGATWIFTRSNGVWSQQGPKLAATDADSDAQQGESVALSSDGNTAVVGGPGNQGSKGAAWVFTRTNGVWVQQGGKLQGAGALSEHFGWCVSLSGDGNTAIVGQPDVGGGGVYVFKRTNGVWTQEESELVGAGGVGNPGQGLSAAISTDGHTAIMGGWRDNSNTGAAWVFTRAASSVRQSGEEVLQQFSLEQNYPNPFNPSTTIRYALPHNSFVTLRVYNTLGQEVAQLVNEQQQPGYHEAVFRSDQLASGVYFYRLQAGDFASSRKLLLLR